jgi:hypothetical protein
MGHVVHDCIQNSPAWHRLRLGIPTASCFDKIVTPAKCELSKSSANYIYELLAEFVMGRPITGIETDVMARGTLMEEPAAKAFTFQTDIEVERIGFVTTEDLMLGASPDRKVVGTNWIVEIKAPASEAVHMRYLMGGEMVLDYRTQLQGQLMVGEYDGVYAVSYHPELPLSVTPVERDEPYIAKLREATEAFVDVLRMKRAEVEERFGPFVWRTAEAELDDAGDLGVSDADVDMIWEHQEAQRAEAHRGQ